MTQFDHDSIHLQTDKAINISVNKYVFGRKQNKLSGQVLELRTVDVVANEIVCYKENCYTTVFIKKTVRYQRETCYRQTFMFTADCEMCIRDRNNTLSIVFEEVK